MTQGYVNGLGHVSHPAITQEHRDRSEMILRCIETDITLRRWSMEYAVENLAGELGISPEAVKLSIAIANDTRKGR
jgi:hypothetical protein